MKRLVATFLIFILIFGSISAHAASIDNVQICADIWVAASNTYLSSEGTAQFFISLQDVANKIYISNCTLQIKVDGSWKSAGSIDTPPEVYYNVNSYATQYNYSAYLIDGTYRIVVTYNIDGHTKSCTSNSVSY